MCVPLYILARWIIGIRVVKDKPLSITSSGVLVISNHQSWYDPFLVSFHIACGGSTLRHFLKSIPLWYPTRSDIIRNIPLGTIIRLMGAYDIGNDSMERAQGLLFTRHLLRIGENVLLFPEGKCVRTGNKVERFHPGINALFLEPIPVILVRMLGINRFSWMKVHLSYQGEFRLKQLEASLSQEEKMRAVQEFYTSPD